MILVHPLIPLILVQIHVAGVCDTPLRILVKLLLNLMPTIILCRVSTSLHRTYSLGPSSHPFHPGSSPDLGPSSHPFNPGSNPCGGRMRYAPTNFGEIIVEFNATDNPVPGLDFAPSDL